MTAEEIQALNGQSEDQLRARITQAQQQGRERFETAQKQTVDLLGWTSLSVPIYEDVDTWDENPQIDPSGNPIPFGTEKKIKAVTVYFRHEIKNDLSTLEFKLPLPPEVEEQYEIRRVITNMLIYREVKSNNFTAKVLDMVGQIVAAASMWGEAIGRNFPTDIREAKKGVDIKIAEIKDFLRGS